MVLWLKDVSGISKLEALYIYMYIYILEKWFLLQGERGHSLSFGVLKKIERKGDRTTDLSI